MLQAVYIIHVQKTNNHLHVATRSCTYAGCLRRGYLLLPNLVTNAAKYNNVSSHIVFSLSVAVKHLLDFFWNPNRRRIFISKLSKFFIPLQIKLWTCIWLETPPYFVQRYFLHLGSLLLFFFYLLSKSADTCWHFVWACIDLRSWGRFEILIYEITKRPDCGKAVVANMLITRGVGT